ncbi:MAG: hypothetical protein IM638_08010 [Bacteroidetes bacterium]|nr:hypothetical protein [Bacteroidota bacterium]
MKSFLLSLSLVVSFTCLAQTDTINQRHERKRFILSVITAGYNRATSSQLLTISAPSTMWYKNGEYRFGSLGQGFQLGIKSAYAVSDRLSVEGGVYYFFSNVIHYAYEWSRNPFVIEGYGKSDQQLLMPRIFAGISVPFYESQKWSFALAGGFTLSRPEITEKIDLYYTNDSLAGNMTTKITGNLSAGFYTSLQCNYRLSENWVVQGELLATGQAWSPEKKTITAYTLDGTDQLPLLNTWQKETLYTNDVPAAQSNTNVPYQAAAISYQLNTLGFQLSIFRQF